MKSLKNILFFTTLVGILIFTSCGNDDGPNLPDSSATVTIDGTTYTKAGDSEIVYLEFSFNDETAYSISGDVVNGTDTVNFSLSLPNLSEATYTKSVNGDDVEVSIYPNDESSFSTSVFGADSEMTDYNITISEVTEQTVSGTFTATVQSFSSDDTREVSGEFVAIDFALLFGELFNQ